VQVILDIIGSTVIGATIILMLFNLNSSMSETSFQNTLDVATQSNSMTIAEMLNHDFYKIGYHESLNGPWPIIETADSNRIRFRSDIDNNGTVDTIEYFTSAPYDVKGSATRFRRLYRTMNGSAGTGADLGLTSFKLTYFDTLGIPVNLPTPTDSASLGRIQSIKIEMTVKNPLTTDSTVTTTFDTTFAATYWEKWISPKNLRVLK